MGFHQTKKALHSKKKTINKVKKEDICKQYIQQQINIRSIQRTYTTQRQKNSKNRQRLNKHFFPKTHRCQIGT